MLKRYLFFPIVWAFIMFFWALPAFAEMIVDTAWVRRYNGPGNSGDVARALTVDDSGNVYVTGESFGSGTGYDYATIKYYPNGDTAWVRTYNGPGNSDDKASALAVDGSGNVYVTGYSAGSGTGSDYATIKYYPNGDTAWVRRYNGPGNSADWAYAIAVDTSGNVYVTGQSYGSGASNSNDYATIKYYPDGNTAWVRRYDGGNGIDWAYAIVVDGSGNVYVTGDSWNGYTYDYVTIKYYPDGDTAWVRRYDGENDYDHARAIAVDSSGNVYVTGESRWSYQNYDYATIKYYPNGDTAWVRRYNGPGNYYDYACAMVVDGSGNVYVTGQSYGSGTNNDYATIKYYPNGDTAWVRRYNGPGNGNDDAYAIAVDTSGNVYVTGQSYGSGANDDYATIKYYPNGDTAWVIRYDGPGNGNDDACDIAVDGFGNVYITGGSGGNGTGLDYATIKYWPNYFPTLITPDSSVFLCAPDTIRFTVTATDPDSMDTLTLFGPGILAPVTGVSPLSVGVGIYVGSLGTFNYFYTVTDSWGATDIDTSTWTITFNSSPTVVAVDSSLFFCDPDTIRFTVTASDPDIADTITLFGPGMSVPLQGVSPLSTDVAIPIDSTGNYSFIYTVSDLCLASGKDTASWMVAVNSQPAPFSLLLPTHDDSIRMPATLWWETSKDTCPNQDIRYDLYLSQSVVFSPDSTTHYVSLSDTFFVIDSLEIKNSYWKVEASDKWGAERWSEQTWSFFVYLCGDCNADDKVDVGDVVWEINYLFKSGPSPKPYAAGNCNGDTVVDVGDVVYLINYLFKSGLKPCE